MEGTGMTKLFQTLLASVPPELVGVLQDIDVQECLFQLNKANSEGDPCAGAGTVLQFAVARKREQHVLALLQHG